MKAKIEENLFLESDGLGFSIKKYSGKVNIDTKTGKETEVSTTEGYFSSVQGAVRHLLKMKVMESTAKDLKELLESVEGIDQYIKDKVAV